MSALGVSLWEVVEARGGPLTESETWAVLAAAATTLQDTTLSGETAATGVGVVTPESVVLLRCGRVELSVTSPQSQMHPHGNYLPPESFENHSLEPQHAERSVMFSLGRSLWACAEYGCQCGPETLDRSRVMSPALRSALSAMTHHLPAHRLSLVDIFQLLVERLNGQDRLNYTATIRALYEEVLGPPQPPPQPPDPAKRRNRSYSALEPKTSSSRKLTSQSWSSVRRSASVEDLPNFSHPCEQPVSHMNPGLTSNSPVVHILQTPKGRAVIRMASIQDVSLLNHSSLLSLDRTKDDTVSNISLRRNLLQSKLQFHSIDNISPAKENIHPTSIDGSRHSKGGGTMNPIQEMSPVKLPPGKPLSESSSTQTFPDDVPNTKISDMNLSPSKDARLAVTVGRSATVAGDMKSPGAEIGGGPRVQKRIPPKKPPRARAMSVDNLLNAEAEMRQGKQEEVPKKRRMVTRAPSRLYRFADPSAALNIGLVTSRGPGILGPEFVVRSKEPVKILSLLHGSQSQRSVVKKVTVVLLTGSRVEFSCDPTVTRVNHVLQAVLEEEGLALAHLLGLAVLGGGEFHFVAPQTKLHKVAPPGWKERHPTKDGLIQDNFTLHLRIMYYLKFNHLHEMDSPSRHLLYLQLRHDLLEGRLPLSSEQLLQLATLALQAEFGDQKDQDAGYFLPEHYVPESLLRGGQGTNLTEELQKLHSNLSGLNYSVAQTRFISIIQESPHYGTHYYHVTQDKGRQQLWLGIGREGVLVLGTGPPSLDAVSRATLHGWPSIKRLSYASHRLTLTLKSHDKAKIKFNLQENRSRHVFYLATVHKSFHRDSTTTPVDLPPPVGVHLLNATEQVSAEALPSLHVRAPSTASSATTTARTSLSSAGTVDELPANGGRLGESGVSGEGARGEHAQERVPLPWPGGGDAGGGAKTSEGLSRANFLSEILWRGGGDESDEVFSLENLENEHQWKQRERQQQQNNQDQKQVERREGDASERNDTLKKVSPHRVFHQRSKSNIESGSVASGLSATGGRSELSREFGSDESLLSSPKKGQTVRMGTRVSAAALQKRRLRSLEGLAQLPSLEELNTTPIAIVVEPSIRSTVVEESVSDSLVERFLQCPSAGGGPERRLETVTLVKKDGSLGVMIAEGVDHGLYIQAVSPGGPADLQGTLRPGDRIVGINGRSVENLPYAAAVDLLRQISDTVTLLVSQPVVSFSHSSSTRSSSTHTTQAHNTPIVSPDARTVAPGAEEDAGEKCKGDARVQLVGGSRSFITEVRSGPVTVITLNATPPPAPTSPPARAPAVSTFEIAVGPQTVPPEGTKHTSSKQK